MAFKKVPKPKGPHFQVYGLPSNPTNWGEAADILRGQQSGFGRMRKHHEAVLDRLDRIERMLAKVNK